MRREDASQALGLPHGAAEAELRAAPRRLRRGAHPDSGGSDWLAARINQARDVLLGGRH
jgi:curved DNA-binding protein CbpA